MYYRSSLDDGQCKPITSRDGKPYYPCGLIANSVFNGTSRAKDKTEILTTVLLFLQTPTKISFCKIPRVSLPYTRHEVNRSTDSPLADGASAQPYNFTEKGITWHNEYKKYTNNPPGSPSDYLPPPNWAARYPDGYTEFPQLASDEHFQVWMKISALPTFTKLWARNDNDVMQAGTYQIVANMSKLSFSDA